MHTTLRAFMKRLLVVLMILLLPARMLMAASSAGLPEGDARFLREAAQAGMFEIQASQMALQRASHPAVKVFAQMMVTQHEEIDDSLKGLASSKHVALPARLDDARQDDLSGLQQGDAADFDRRYVDRVAVAAHEAAVKLFSRAAEQSGDPQVKQFAADTLAVLRQHLAKARNVARALQDGLPANGGEGRKNGLPPMYQDSSSPSAGASGRQAGKPAHEPPPGSPAHDAQSQ